MDLPVYNYRKVLYLIIITANKIINILDFLNKINKINEFIDTETNCYLEKFNILYFQPNFYILVVVWGASVFFIKILEALVNMFTNWCCCLYYVYFYYNVDILMSVPCFKLVYTCQNTTVQCKPTISSYIILGKHFFGNCRKNCIMVYA